MTDTKTPEADALVAEATNQRNCAQAVRLLQRFPPEFEIRGLVVRSDMAEVYVHDVATDQGHWFTGHSFPMAILEAARWVGDLNKRRDPLAGWLG